MMDNGMTESEHAAARAASELENAALAALRHHVTGAVERGEAEPIIQRVLSPVAAGVLLDAVENGLSMFDYETDSLEGQTDCPEGCTTEPDGWCRHGWLSASETMLRTVG